jgi:hypothetical protein
LEEHLNLNCLFSGISHIHLFMHTYIHTYIPVLRATDHSSVDETVEEDDHSSVDEAVEEDDTSWSRLDIFLSVYVLLVIWGPVFAALLLSFILPIMKPDLEINLARALGFAGGIVFAYLLAMAQLSRRKPLFFLYAVYYTLLIYVDAGIVAALVVLLIFLPESAILFILITLAGWLFLILVARRIILASHDYVFSETMPSDGIREDKLEAILQRGIDENAFRYKYIPKTHLILICNICIFCGIIMGSFVWKDSLKITLPVSVVCVVDIFYSSCFRFEDEDEDPAPGVII